MYWEDIEVRGFELFTNATVYMFERKGKIFLIMTLNF